MLIKISTGGAAFHAPYPENDSEEDIAMSEELRHIFDRICAQIADGGRRSGRIIDSNGNSAGEWDLDKD